jgi:hypothetical protein
MPENIAIVEFWREVATIVMLIGIGYLSGKNFAQRFAYFMLSFAIWDVFYYVFLYLTIGWPLTIADWDILFLIPMPWIGPVWAPCLISFLLMIMSLYVIYKVEKMSQFKLQNLSS